MRRPCTVGEPVFTSKAHDRNALANSRAVGTLKTFEACDLAPAPRKICNQAADGAAIAQRLTSVLWSRPNTELLLKVRRARVKLKWGDHRGTRCPEIVIALLSNPTKSDPIGAIYATRLMRLRRRVRGERDELANFVRQFKTRPNAIDIN